MNPLLAAASQVYRAGLKFDRFFKEKGSSHLPGPVVSIGNVSVGGTGKTPLLIRLAQDLKKKQKTPAILTRGYRGLFKRSSPSQIVRGDSTDLNLFSDETILLAESLEQTMIGVGPDRVKSAEEIHSIKKPDVFILDDGFQHWKIKRDWDVVCIDATDPWAGGHLVPWGRLREPLCSLSRADLIVITRSEFLSQSSLHDIGDKLGQVAPQSEVIKSYFESALIEPDSGQVQNWNGISGKRVVALSGIGHPKPFELNLEKKGAEVIPLRFPDHHAYSDDDLRRIEEQVQQQNAILITTKKDWVKLRQTIWAKPEKRPATLYVVDIKVGFDERSQRVWDQYLEKFLNEKN